jgi:hypothetical protein
MLPQRRLTTPKQAGASSESLERLWLRCNAPEKMAFDAELSRVAEDGLETVLVEVCGGYSAEDYELSSMRAVNGHSGKVCCFMRTLPGQVQEGQIRVRNGRQRIEGPVQKSGIDRSSYARFASTRRSKLSISSTAPSIKS